MNEILQPCTKIRPLYASNKIKFRQRYEYVDNYYVMKCDTCVTSPIERLNNSDA